MYDVSLTLRTVSFPSLGNYHHCKIINLIIYINIKQLYPFDMQDQLTISQQFKEEGNIFLKDNHFEKAVDSYTKAIETASAEGSRVPKNKLSIYYANRSFAQIKLQNYGLAIPDAESSIANNPAYEKAYLRLAFSQEVLLHYKEAYNAYLKAFQISGKKDEFIYSKLVNCKNENDQFIRNKKLSLLHDDKERGPKKEKPYKNWREIVVENDYGGLRLEQNQNVTTEWMIKLMQNFKDQKALHKRYTLQLIEKCKEMLSTYQTLVDYPIEQTEEITICGDIHGQYYDLFNIFKLNGLPAIDNKYHFNGDFVDRGSFSVECMLTLIGWKVVNKEFMHMTRGNHQAKQVNHIYGFKGEVEAKYKDIGVYQAFSELFCALPVVYVYNKKVMVCHGGLPSEDSVSLKEIRQAYRFVEPPEKGMMCDLIWADPTPQNGRSPSKRGASMGFGPDITKKFLDTNGLSTLIRSHQVKDEGYEEAHGGRCITIFSAPNYCDFSGNRGAYIRLNGKDLIPKFTKFTAVPHPPVGPMAYAGQFKGMF